MVPERMKPIAVPLSTYRLQFNRSFTFSQATELVPYLAELGISHCYASPYLRARPGSLHGYDIIDHHSLNPEIGTPEEYDRLVFALRQHGMGQILDIVPNHMGVMGADNTWWLNVLENGEASTNAAFFDIDWYPLKDELQRKILVPVLGDQYGTVLDRGELELRFDPEKGEFSIFYFEHRFPVDAREYPRILGFHLEQLERRVGSQSENLLELQSLQSAFSHLPARDETAPEKIQERSRDKEIHKRRLAELCARSSEVTEFLTANVAKINGTPGDSASFEFLHELIKAQAYRLAYWRVSADDINYRRFFDIDDLAGLRQEDESVFWETHEFVFELLRQGKIDGLRVDHPDGLYNPRQYFERLQRAQAPSAESDCTQKSYYVVAEKILTGQEKLPANWPIHGTTGYAFANRVNGLFIDPDGETKLDRIYRVFTGRASDFQELVMTAKKLVMDRSLNSELNVLASHLSRIALADRHTCDFTLKGLRDALTEVVACFPVYRTYVSEQEVSKEDRLYIEEAVECAKAKSTAADSSVYEFIREVLLTTRRAGHVPFYQNSVIHFAMRFQQYTSALMAKGLEDTSFYRYHRLASLNDVGGDPLRFSVSVEDFHRETQEQSQLWPHEMLTTSTHDSKRSEDVRARINVISEMPAAWHRQVRIWRDLNRNRKTLHEDCQAPTANDEYLFYQTILGAWPFGRDRQPPAAEFRERIQNYMLKAIREAKQETSWANQNQAYELGVRSFVDAVLLSSEFRDHFVPFQRIVAYFGMLNSLAQTTIKLTAPGIPDIYQGNELWDFSLVDPDNRHPVDYRPRRQALREFQGHREPSSSLADCVRELAHNMEDGRIKLYVIWKTLGLRKQQPDLLRDGEYLPLATEGACRKHLFAFARRSQNRLAIVAVPRLCARLLKGEPRLPSGDDVWEDTIINLSSLSESSFGNVFTGRSLQAESSDNRQVLRAGQLFTDLPVAVLTSRAN
jgi:(1->4)-alpha-D-glucan 1-alpha-D-glucosylmutase